MHLYALVDFCDCGMQYFRHVVPTITDERQDELRQTFGFGDGIDPAPLVKTYFENAGIMAGG